jgi:hypothetical protein
MTATTMPYKLDYIADEYTAKITPQALIARLRQSGFPVSATMAEEGVIEIESGDVNLEVYVEDVFVSDIVGEITFVNDKESERLLELLESMGWLAADDADADADAEE